MRTKAEVADCSDLIGSRPGNASGVALAQKFA